MRQKGNIIIAALLFSLLFNVFFLSCDKKQEGAIITIKNRDSVAGLEAKKVTTVISDSGITRYRIYADKWDIYDKLAEPYWEFPSGLHFERFDETMHIDANFHSNYAKYFEKDQLWKFKGDVRVINIKGEMFETEELFWDQRQKRIYSDTVVKITLLDKVIVAKGITGNETFTKIHAIKPEAVFAIDEERN